MIDEFVWEPGHTPLSDGRIPAVVSTAYVLACCAHNRAWATRRGAPAAASNSELCGAGEWRTIKLVAAAHNAALVLLSTVTCLAVAAEAMQLIRMQGFYATFCPEPLWEGDPRGKTLMRGALHFWCYVYYISKYYELVDTLLMAAMDKRIIPLHIWHHSIIIPAVWLEFQGNLSMSLFGVACVNSFVHVIMYSYYFCCAVGLSWGRWKSIVTRIQLVQFCCGLIGASWFLQRYYTDLRFVPGSWALTYTQGCAGDPVAIWAGNLLTGSFLLLFTRFFQSTYKKDQ